MENDTKENLKEDAKGEELESPYTAACACIDDDMVRLDITGDGVPDVRVWLNQREAETLSGALMTANSTIRARTASQRVIRAGRRLRGRKG